MSDDIEDEPDLVEMKLFDGDEFELMKASDRGVMIELTSLILVENFIF